MYLSLSIKTKLLTVELYVSGVYQWRNHALALTLFVLCIPYAKGAPPDTLAVSQLQTLGDTLFAQEKYDSAHYYYGQVQVQSEQLTWWEGYVKACMARANVAYYQNDHHTRILFARDAVKAGTTYLETPHFHIASAYQEIGNAWLALRQHDTSIYYLQLASNAFQGLENWEEAAFCGIGMGINHWRNNDFTAAAAQLKTVYELAKAHLPDSSGVYPYLFNIQGVLYQTIGDYDNALDISQKALAMAGDDSLLLTKTYGTIGTIYWSKGDFDKGISYYELALIIGKHLRQPPLIAVSYNNLSAAYFKQNNARKARFYATESLRIYEGMANAKPKQLIETYNNLAACYTELNVPDSALYFLGLGRQVSELDSSRLGTTYHNIAQAYRKKGDPLQAKTYFQLALQKNHIRYGECHPSIAKQYRMLGQLQADKGRHQQAITHFQQALATLSKGFEDTTWSRNPDLTSVSDKLELLRCLRDKGKSLSAMAQQSNNRQFHKMAFQVLTEAVVLIDYIRRSYSIEQSRQFFMEMALPVYELAIEVALELAIDSSRAAYYRAKAFDFVERSKAISLLMHLNELRAGEFAGLPDSLRQQERDLKLNLAFYEDQLIKEQQKGAKADSIRMEVWQKKTVSYRRHLEELIEFLERAYPKYYQLKYATQVADIAAIQSFLPDNEASLLAYFVGEKAVYQFGISKKSLLVHKTAITDSLLDNLQIFIQQLYRQDIAESQAYNHAAFAAWTHQSHRLFQTWIAPILTELATNPSRMIVIPDGWLSYLPFELLLSDEAASYDQVDYVNLPYLLKKYAIQYEYSATLLLSKEARMRRPKSLFAGFAPVYEKSLAGVPIALTPLKYNQQETELIHEQLGGIAIVGQAATEAAFRSEVSLHTILHLAAHAFTDDNDPRNSALVLAEVGGQDPANDGLLHAHEVYNLQLRADLTVLSACKTGSGQFARGEGVMSLSRAFRYAGCPSVVMSLWQADDNATSELMHLFYHYLHQGMDKDHALRTAKLEFITQNPKQHPFYWAPFVLVGKANPLPVGGWPYWPFILGGLLFGAFVVWWRFG